MKVTDYDYSYPESSIAFFPPEKRGTSALFIVDTQTGEIKRDIYENLDKYIASEDVLVRNITKVFHARLFGKSVSLRGDIVAENVEVFLTEPHAQTLDEYAKRQYDEKEQGYWLEFLAAKRHINLAKIQKIAFSEGFALRSITKVGESYKGLFYCEARTLSVEELFTFFERQGKVPLPPYIKRDSQAADSARYQTIFAEKLGSVAAPTASLNFTQTLEERLKKQGTAIEEITLHVGRGTFLPLRNETIEENVLHSEPFFVPIKTMQHLHQAKIEGRRVIAMGTTTTRTLETLASRILGKNSFSDVLSETNLFVYPPYHFSIVDALLTNFHFPKSSLITLVDAFLQDRRSKISWKTIYDYAIQNDAKLFSYGDSMLLL